MRPPGQDVRCFKRSRDGRCSTTSGSELGEADQTLDSADETVTIAAIISASGTYTVRWWVDLNGSGSCEAPPDDHSWEVVDADADAGGLSIDHAHDVMFSDVCDSW